MNVVYTEGASALRAALAASLSPYRMAHTLGVECAAVELAALYCPEKEPMLRIAALLHDVTKEYTEAQHLAVFKANGIVLRADEQASPQVWHGLSAALEIPRLYPDFANEELLSAVRWHTTGRAGMTLCDALIYLADLIEQGRTFADCVSLRAAFWDADPAGMSLTARRRHLRNVILRSLEQILERLQDKGVCMDTLAAFEDLKNKSEI